MGCNGRSIEKTVRNLRNRPSKAVWCAKHVWWWLTECFAVLLEMGHGRLE